MNRCFDIPGEVISSDWAPDSWLLHFRNVPWPTAFGHQELRRMGNFQEGHQWLWWQKHRGLTLEVPALHDWLFRVLDPFVNYLPQEVAALLVEARCPLPLYLDQLFRERLFLMRRWNGWLTRKMPGFYYLHGRHFERRSQFALPLPRVGEPPIQEAYPHQELLEAIQWEENYALEDLFAALPQEMHPILLAVQKTWGEKGPLRGSQWVLGIHLEMRA